MNLSKLLKAAYIEAQKSTNISTQNSAMLVNDNGDVIISAVNSFPIGVEESNSRQDDTSLRYKYSVHAERNVIFLAAREGIKTEGLIMISPWATCSDCAQAIIQAGIKKLITHKQAYDRSGNWKDNIDFSLEMLQEAGVEVIMYDAKLNVGKILRAGSHWEP